MSSKTVLRSHTGLTDKGHIRDMKVERIGRVTIYKRGRAYYTYYRESGRSIRRRVEGNLNAARAVASSINHAIQEGRASPFGYKRIGIKALVDDYIDYCESVRCLAFRTVDRYRAALSHLIDFAGSRNDLAFASQLDHAAAEDFVRWLRKQSRTRNGRKGGRQSLYAAGGIKFILSTCRTAFNWARRKRYLPPYDQNPFGSLGIEDAFGRDQPHQTILSHEQELAFFQACDNWQKPMFLTLAVYGLRVGELTHMLISDVDMKEGLFHIRSKPEMFWRVKTGHERALPIVPGMRKMFEELIGGRKEGFLFLSREFAGAGKRPSKEFSSAAGFSSYLRELADRARQEGKIEDKEILRSLTPSLRDMGQVPEKRIREEFMRLTARIGCPEFTRVHSLRHLFSTRAQEQGMNPILVQGILGHSSLDMTRRYTHIGIEAKRKAVGQMLAADPVLRQIAPE